MALVDWLFPLAILALLGVAYAGLRDRVLARVAFRNTRRRPKQTLLVILGLLVGSALVSAALVTSDSMEYAIVQATYDSFEAIDETVFLEGYSFFPQAVATTLAQDAELQRVTDAVGSNVIWSAAVTNEDSAQYEPNVRLIGFDPAPDRAFGSFERGSRRFTGEDLAPDEVILHHTAAKRLDAAVGDHLTLNFSRPLDPILPRFEEREGMINASTSLPPPVGQPVDPLPWTSVVRIESTIVRLSAVLQWNESQGQDLDWAIESPQGQVYTNTTGAALDPDGHFIDVPGSLGNPVPRGDWTIHVQGKPAVRTTFNVTIIQLEPIYDLEAFEQRLEELRAEFPDFDPGDADSLGGRHTRTVRVAAVTDGGKGPNFLFPTPLNLFIRLDTLQDFLARPGEVNLVKVSNPGGVEAGADQTDRTYPVLWARLNATKEANPDHPAIQALKANDDKVFWLAQAERVGEQFTIFLSFISSFSVLAGLLLIVNIFTMLAEERKAELGISRAVGMRRRHLTRLFLLEGAFYALIAIGVGTVAGLGLAATLVWGFNAFGDSEIFPPIPFRLETASLMLAFAIGVLLTIGTIYVGARRASRLNIVRAIRNLEEPETMRERWSLWGGLATLAAGLLFATYGLLNASFPAGVTGPTLLILGAGLLLRRRFHRRLVYPILALILFGYLTWTLFVVKRYETIEDNIFSPVRAVIMALCLVVVVVYIEAAARGLGWILSRIPWLRPVAKPATSYPLHRRFRTGLTLSMFAVILLVVTMFSIFGAIFRPNPEQESGGYEIEGYASVPFERLEDHGNDPQLLKLVDYYDVIPYRLEFGAELVTVSNGTVAQFGPPRDYIFGIDAHFAGVNRFILVERDAAYATDADAYRAVANSTDLVIVSNHYSHDEEGNEEAHHVGEWLQIHLRGSTKQYRIAGIQDQFHWKGVWLPKETVRTLYPNTDTLVLISLAGNVDDVEAALRFEAAYRDVGMDAKSIRADILEQNASFRQIFTLIQLFLSLGLIIGILSLGIVTTRSIIERRQEIGMLRALGYRRRDVRRAFLVEMWTMVGLGVFLGTLVAMVVSFGIWFTLVREEDLPYTIPWWDLGVIALIAFVATTLATLGPIIRASRIPPAEALRYIE